MEMNEIASAHVAFPVLAVVFCAFLVFLFGFKSPAQPPSFDFEDDRRQNQRKGKKSKPKSQNSGPVIAVPVPEDLSVKSSSPRPNKQIASPKTNRSEAKVAKADVKKERNKKEAKDEVKDKAVNTKITLEDDGEWEVQRSRKDKKTKPRKEEGAAVAEEVIKKVDELAKLADDIEPESASAAGETKTKKKKKPSKVFEVAQSKKSRKKKEKKQACDSQEEAVAIPKVAESVPSSTPVLASAPMPASPVAAESSVVAEAKPARSPKKKKNKETSPASSASSTATQQSSRAVKEESIKFTEASKPAQASSPKVADKSKGAASEAEAPAAAAPQVTKAEAAAVSPPVTFDQLGGSSDAWIEAPKSKKKKARREN